MTTNAQRAAGAVIGLVFGLVICWSGMASPAIIREALLFEDPYLFLFMASAVGTAALGLHLVRGGRRPDPALDRPQRRHVVGSVVFGLGWGLANVCPGPVATQVGQGIGWGLVTFAGVVLGVWLYLRRGGRETEPAADPASTTPALQTA